MTDAARRRWFLAFSQSETFTSIALLCAMVFGVTVFVTPSQGQDTQDPLAQVKALSLAFRMAANAVAPSVVTIISKAAPEEKGGDAEDLENEIPFSLPPGLRLPEGFRLPDGLRPFAWRSVGSGILIDSSGIVLTNSHVVRGASEVAVRLADGREFQATDIKADSLSDLAILSINGVDGLKAAELGDSDKLNIGDWVIAIGSPFELEATVSAGIVSGKGRSVHQIRRGKVLQTDAAINPGNSGGPLVNMDGEVVGINTAIATRSGGNQGIGFAIPVNRAKWVVAQLRDVGQVRRAYLGIYIRDVDAGLARQMELPVHYGVLISRVFPDTPAAQAGLEDDDVVIEFAGTKVRDTRDLQDTVEQKPFDSKHSIKILRGGRTMTLEVVVKPLREELEEPKIGLPLENDGP